MGDRYEEVGARIEALLDQLSASGDPAVAEKAEELVTLLVELYGGGLERILGAIADEGAAGEELIAKLAQDELVKALMIVHGLHPVDLDQRVQDALDSVRPYLGSHSGGVDNLGIDEGGVLHLRLEGNCEGCPSSRVTVKLAIEDAVHKAAPEIAGIDVQGVVEEEPAAGNLLQIGGLRTAPAASAGSPSTMARKTAPGPCPVGQP